jgi:hypothetical protein
VYIAYKQTGSAFGYVTADTEDFASDQAFKDAVLNSASLELAGSVTTLTTLNGHTLEIQYDDRGTAAFGGVDTDRQKIDGERVVYDTWPRMQSPFAEGAVGAETLRLQHGDDIIDYDIVANTWTTSQTTAIQSAAAPLARGLLHGKASAQRYRIDGRTMTRSGQRAATGIFLQQTADGSARIELIAY